MRPSSGVWARPRIGVLKAVGLRRPLLGAGAVAVPQLQLGGVGGATTGHVKAPADCGQRGTAPGPVLVRGRGLTVPQLGRGAVHPGVITGDVHTLPTGTDD